MAVVAAAIQRKEREIVNTFRGAGATSPERARDPGELAVDQHLAFKRLANRAILREAGDGRYYLDEQSWEAFRRLRHRIAIVMLLIVIAMIVVMIVSGGFIAGSKPA